jgi:peptide/nickel transport system substrate-binding protein
MSRKHVVAAAVVGALLLAACSSKSKESASSTTAGGGTNPSTTAGQGPTTTATKAPNGTITIANVQGQTWTCGFNPFNPAVNSLSVGPVYEPLVYVNSLKNQATTPMLASAFAWSADKKTLTFTIRDGITWNDGQPFSADDVLFTFNLLKKYPALDLNAVWSSGLTGVTAAANKVTMTFKAPAQPYFFYVASLTAIVPKHSWTTGDAAKDPVTFQDANPVGTGPFMVNPCSANLITYTANTKYWQPGLPHIAKVLYPAYTDNGPANLDLANDKAQWGGQYIPGMQQFYVAKDPTNHHVWLPPTVNVELFFNLKHDVTSQLAVRQAFAYGIDRAAVSQVGEGGLQPPANQAGIVVPTFKDWYDESTSGQYNHDTAKATAALASAGYSPSKPLDLTVITISGYTDWDASLAEIKQQLKPLGINLTINDLAQTTYNDKLFKGDFDLAYGNGSIAPGPAPYYELRQLLYSANSAPLGQNASTNYERYSDKATDALLDQYAAADDATQHEIVKKLQAVMINTIPIVPTTESVDWYQYNTKDISGWPTPDDPYARPAPYAIPDWGQVLLHLEHK